MEKIFRKHLFPSTIRFYETRARVDLHKVFAKLEALKHLLIRKSRQRFLHPLNFSHYFHLQLSIQFIQIFIACLSVVHRFLKYTMHPHLRSLTVSQYHIFYLYTRIYEFLLIIYPLNNIIIPYTSF